MIINPKQPPMKKPEIKHVIFDFGQVLVKFDPEYMCRQYLTNDSDVKTAAEILFDRKYWDRLDAGTIEDEELLGDAKERLPSHLREYAEKIYYGWIYNLPEIEGMRETVELCKRKGYNVYLLSNISHYFADRYEHIPILSSFDGFVFSAKAGCVKPSYEIFSHITKKFNLTPCQTLFIDDNENNVKGADKFGIAAYHFDGDSKNLHNFISSL